jgi:hypothetical protein
MIVLSLTWSVCLSAVQGRVARPGGCANSDNGHEQRAAAEPRY